MVVFTQSGAQIRGIFNKVDNGFKNSLVEINGSEGGYGLGCKGCQRYESYGQDNNLSDFQENQKDIGAGVKQGADNKGNGSR